MALKHRRYTELGDPVPAIPAWGMALLSLVLVLAVLMWGQLAATGLRYARLQERFAVLAANGRHLHRLLDDESFRPILEQHGEALRSLMPVVSFIDKGNLSRAQQY